MYNNHAYSMNSNQRQMPSKSNPNYMQQPDMYRQSSYNMQSPYPYYPPFDSQIDFYQNTVVRQDPVHKTIKTCPICQYPAHIRMVSLPCQHYFCYECYEQSKLQCSYCGSLNSEIKRLNDYDQEVYSCDSHCYKVFNDQQELQKHIDMVAKTSN